MNRNVLVIGAGTGGLAAALKMAEKGIKVTVLEKSPEETFGNTWCNYVEVDGFRKYGLPVPIDGEVAFDPFAPVDYRTTDHKGRLYIRSFDHYLLKMSVYQKRLANLCRAKGAELIFGEKVTGLIRKNGRTEGVTTESGKEFTADPVVISAGYASKMTCSIAGLNEDDLKVRTTDTVSAIQEIWKIDPDAAKRAVSDGLIPDRDIVLYTGVSGPFSTLMYQLDLSRGIFGILAGTRSHEKKIETPRGLIDKTLKDLPFCREMIYGGGRPLPIRNPADSMVGDGLVALGDFACMTNPTNGSGTLLSMIAGSMCADIIHEIKKAQKPFSTENLWSFNYRFQSRFGGVLASFYLSQRMIVGLTEKDIQNLLRFGLMKAKDFNSAHQLRPIKIGPIDGISRLIGGIKMPGLLFSFVRTGLQAERIMRHYKNYPGEWDEEKFSNWREKKRKLFSAGGKE